MKAEHAQTLTYFLILGIMIGYFLWYRYHGQFLFNVGGSAAWPPPTLFLKSP